MIKTLKALNESSLSRIWRHVTAHDSGTITAYRSARNCGSGPVYTRAENKKRNKILSSKLLKMGYSITKIKGVYIENYGSENEVEVKEEAFIVIDVDDTGRLKKDLMALGKMFEQDSITFSKPNGEYYLISTNECPYGYPGEGKIGVEVKLGSPMFGNKGVFFSRVNGRPFVFESLQTGSSMLKHYPPTEIRAIEHFANMEVE